MSLLLYEESMEQTTQKTMNDITKKGTKVKITPISDVMGFLTAIANTHALAKVLFSTTSPLTIGLKDLREIVLDGKQTTKVQKISQYQPNWFAHAMWQLHEHCSDFFKKRLSQQDLLEGARLRNPLAAYNNDMECWIMIKQPGVPLALRYEAGNDDIITDDTPSTPGGKRPRDPVEVDDPSPKKPKATDRKKGGWKDNPSYDAGLKKLKQNIFQSHGCTNLGQLLQASNTTIPATLHMLGFSPNTCGRWTLWGGCGDPACTLTHLDKPLQAALLPKISHLLSEGAAKLALSKAQA